MVALRYFCGRAYKFGVLLAACFMMVFVDRLLFRFEIVLTSRGGDVNSVLVDGPCGLLLIFWNGRVG